MKKYPYTPRQLNNARSEYAANLALYNEPLKHRPPSRYIQKAARYNHTISGVLPWLLLLGCMVAVGLMLAWRG